MSNNSTALVATVKVVDDATTPLGKIQDSLRKAGATDEEINKQIANSQLMVEIAQKGRLSTSQQLKFAMDAEAAKGSDLGTELVTLEREYATLVKQMQAMAKYGVEVPQSMISQANAAKKAADSIREQTEKTKDLDEKSKSAAFGVGAANDSMSGMGSVMNGLPGQVSKVAGGLGLVTQAASGMGKGVGEAAGKITFLATTVASGGPLGIGIAAASIAIGAGAALWKVYKQEAEALNSFLPSLSGTFKLLGESLKEQIDGVSNLSDELIYFGKTAREQSLGILTEQTEAQEKAIASNTKMIGTIKDQADAMRKRAEIAFMTHSESGDALMAEAKALDAQAKALEDGTEIARESLIQKFNRITLLEELVAKEAAHKKSIEDKTKAVKAGTEASKELAEENASYERQAQADADRSFKQYKAGLAEEEKARQDLIDTTTAGTLKRIAEEKKASAAVAAEQKKQTDAYIQTASVMGEAFGAGFAGLITGQEGAGKAMVSTVVRSAMSQITAYAVTAAAGAASAEAGIPIVGPILAAAAMAAMSAMVMGLVSQLPSFHTGGVVGADDGMRLPGMKSNERLVNALVGERFVAPGASAGGGGGGGTSVVINAKSLFAPTSADTKRMVNQVGKALRRQRRLGYAT